MKINMAKFSKVRNFCFLENEAAFRHIELCYNRKRLHSSQGYMTLVEYRLSKQAA